MVTNVLNGHQYVGLTTKTVAHRWSEHKTSAVIGKKTYLYSALRKYGPDAFTVTEFMSVFNASDLSSIEREVIKDLHPAYNQTNGGEFTQGRKHTPEIIERIRASNVGKIKTAEHRQKIRDALADSPKHAARLRSEENLAALDAARAKIDQVKRIAAVKKAASDRVWTEESRAKLSASCMGRRYGPEVIARMAASKRKAVKCNETGVVYTCREEAAEKTGISANTVWRHCKGKTQKAAKGLTFSYIEV